MHCFSLLTENQVAHLVLNQPETMNTMNPTFWRELDDTLTKIHKDGTTRVLVISSTGKHFSAGMSLEAFGDAIAMDDQSQEGRAAIYDFLNDMQSTITKLETLRIPVIAAIQGGCIGGALDLVTACCIRYASAESFFCIQEINIGMVADIGTLQRLPKLVPLGLVKELAYTGRRLTAEQAKTHGLVNDVLDTPAQALEAAIQCAREIAEKAPIAIWGTKQAVHYARDHSVDDALRQMSLLQGVIWSNQNIAEAVLAKKERRLSTFPGLSRLNQFAESKMADHLHHW